MFWNIYNYTVFIVRAATSKSITFGPPECEAFLGIHVNRDVGICVLTYECTPVMVHAPAIEGIAFVRVVHDLVWLKPQKAIESTKCGLVRQIL